MVPGLSQITYRIVLTQKLRKKSPKEKERKSRNSCKVSSGVVGTQVKFATEWHLETNIRGS